MRDSQQTCAASSPTPRSSRPQRNLHGRHPPGRRRRHPPEARKTSGLRSTGKVGICRAPALKPNRRLLGKLREARPIALTMDWEQNGSKSSKKSRRVLMLRDPTIGAGSGMLGAIQGVAPSFGVELSPIAYREPITLTRYVETFSRRPNGGLIVVPNPNATVHLDLMVGLAAKYRLPTIYPYRYFPESGGLISYGIDNLDLWRRAAGYVDRVLKGEK